MKRMTAKKVRERRYLKRFLSVANLLQGITIRRPKRDPPDFSAKTPKGRISIEVTELHVDAGLNSGSRLREGEVNRELVRTAVRDRLARSGLPALLVAIGFSSRELGTRKARTLVDPIFHLIVTHKPSNPGEVELGWSDFAARGEYGTVWPEGLEYLTIARGRGIGKHFVLHSETGWVAERCVAPIQAIIQRKGRKLSRYATRYTANWLLIVVGGYGPSSFIKPDRSTRIHRYQLLFDRVFIYLDRDADWFQLK